MTEDDKDARGDSRLLALPAPSTVAWCIHYRKVAVGGHLIVANGVRLEQVDRGHLASQCPFRLDAE